MSFLTKVIKLQALPASLTQTSRSLFSSSIYSPHFSTVAAQKKKKKTVTHPRNEWTKPVEEDFSILRPLPETRVSRWSLSRINFPDEDAEVPKTDKLNAEQKAQNLQLQEEEDEEELELVQEEEQEDDHFLPKEISRLYSQSEKFDFFQMSGYEYFPTEEARQSGIPTFLSPKQREMVARALMISDGMAELMSSNNSYSYSMNDEDRDFAVMLQVQSDVNTMREAKQRMMDEAEHDETETATADIVSNELKKSEELKNNFELYHHNNRRQSRTFATPNKIEHKEEQEDEEISPNEQEDRQRELKEQLMSLSTSWEPFRGNALDDYYLSGLPLTGNSFSSFEGEAVNSLNVERTSFQDVDEIFNSLKAYELASDSRSYESLSAQEQFSIDRHNERMLFLVGSMDAILPMGRYHENL